MTEAVRAATGRGEVAVLRVFVRAGQGGNPVPLVADATAMTAAQMQQVARHHGHESAFVLPADDAGADWRIRFFVPQHEMEMCGHATVGALWALRQWRLWTRPGAVVQTLSGRVDVHWDDRLQQVWISQPRATWTALAQAQRAQIAAVLGLDPSGPLPPMANAATSRVKTLVRLDSVAQLQALRPDFAGMHALCDAIGSTGLYPYALGDGAQDNGVVLFARQFPRASGYPEDAATGIAAAALWGHLAGTGRIDAGTPQAPATCVVRQGDAMGQPSAIEVQARFDPWGAVQGCWIGGRVDWAAP